MMTSCCFILGEPFKFSEILYADGANNGVLNGTIMSTVPVEDGMYENRKMHEENDNNDVVKLTDVRVQPTTQCECCHIM
jgi:hypothetical protein